MFNTIIWATDGSAAADLALPFVKELASEKDSAVVVVHVEEVLMGPSGGWPLNADEEDLRSKVERQAHELSDSGLNVRLKVMNAVGGGPAHQIAAAARESGADLIVVGTRGHTSLAGLLLGAVTQRLLHIAPCPVFAVPARGQAEGAGAEEAHAEAAT